MTQIKWRKIDPKNLPKEASIILKNDDVIITNVDGFLYSSDGVKAHYRSHKDGSKTKVTHYLTESDLLSLEEE